MKTTKREKISVSTKIDINSSLNELALCKKQSTFRARHINFKVFHLELTRGCCSFLVYIKSMLGFSVYIDENMQNNEESRSVCTKENLYKFFL